MEINFQVHGLGLNWPGPGNTFTSSYAMAFIADDSSKQQVTANQKSYCQFIYPTVLY